MDVVKTTKKGKKKKKYKTKIFDYDNILKLSNTIKQKNIFLRKKYDKINRVLITNIKERSSQKYIDLLGGLEEEKKLLRKINLSKSAYLISLNYDFSNPLID